MFYELLRAGGASLGVLAVPVDRLTQPRLQLDPGLPSHHRPDLARVDVLAVDLPGRAACTANLGLGLDTR